MTVSKSTMSRIEDTMTRVEGKMISVEGKLIQLKTLIELAGRGPNLREQVVRAYAAK